MFFFSPLLNSPLQNSQFHDAPSLPKMLKFHLKEYLKDIYTHLSKQNKDGTNPNKKKTEVPVTFPSMRILISSGVSNTAIFFRKRGKEEDKASCCVPVKSWQQLN
jgi:hypothetical protein